MAEGVVMCNSCYLGLFTSDLIFTFQEEILGMKNWTLANEKSGQSHSYVLNLG